MSNFKLNLPTDIPWKRICVSNDMVDPKICDRKKLKRWRSSIAVFKYEPPEEFQDYDGLTISYLKVSCSITGYQEDPEEIGLNARGIGDYWKNQPGIENYLEVLQKYYPCYGAVLEVAVAPHNDSVPVSKYPYFLDFTPKKRELYELVSETGETLSRSLNNVEIGKSNSSLQSHEVMDIDKGFSVSGAVDTEEVGISGAFSKQQESGSRSVNQTQDQNIKTTNTSQEMRELQSHTTQLSQMYHQLDSYHLGTNRAVFFIHPRPHTIQTEHTFVNGPRNIEGIQEFMFVVARPKDVKEICVEAYLETGHIGRVLGDSSVEEVPHSEKIEFYNDSFEAMYTVDSETTNYDDQDKIWKVSDHFPGYEIKAAKITLGSPKFLSEDDGPDSVWALVDSDPKITHIDKSSIKVSGKVHSFYKNIVIAADNRAGINYPFQVKITLVKTVRVKNESNVLFLTGRGLCCCKPKNMYPGGIVAEVPTNLIGITARREPTVQVKNMTIQEANQTGLYLKEAIVKSRNDVQNRYADGGVKLHQTNFANETLLASIQSNTTVRINTLKSIRKPLRDKVLNFNQSLNVNDLLKMPMQMQCDLFDLSNEEALELRNSLVGFNHKIKDKKLAWLNPKQREVYLQQQEQRKKEERKKRKPKRRK